MEGIIIALIGAFATIATAFISKSSDKSQGTESPKTHKREKDNQYYYRNDETISQKKSTPSRNLTWKKVFLRLLGIILCISALLCFFGAIVNLSTYWGLSINWGTAFGFIVIGVAFGLTGLWLFKIS